MWNASTCDCKCNEACKIDEYLDTKNCSCRKRLFGKLMLICEDNVLNTSENNYLIYCISLVIISLSLLVVISISCYYYYTKHW